MTAVKTEPKVSVIIPTYNNAKYVTHAVESAIEQTYTDYEIIVIDDGSTDNTRNVLDPYRDRINYIYQEHQGVSTARNLGIEQAKGELIAFLDADDYFLPEHLAQQTACLEDRPLLGMVSSGWYRVDRHGEVLSENKPWQVLPKLNLETWLLSRPVLPTAIMVRKEWLEAVDGFKPEFELAQDIDLILRLSLRGCQAQWSKKITSCYRASTSNATNDTIKQAKFFDAVYDRFFLQDDLPESVAKLEDKARYSYLKWLGWRLYHTNNYSWMTNYLSKSLIYSHYSRTETVSDWIEYFESCSVDEGYKLNSYSLSSSQEWRHLIKHFVIESNKCTRSANIQKENLILEVGKFLEVQGKTNSAIEHYEKALQAESNLAEVKKRLETLLAVDFPQKTTFSSSTTSNLVKLKVFPPKELFLLPSISDTGIVDNLFQFGKHYTPEAYVTALKHGRAFIDKNSSYIITSDNKLVEDLCVNLEPSKASFSLPHCHSLDGFVAFLSLGNNDNNNYLDSIFDLVARIKLLEVSGTDLKLIDKFIIDRSHLKFAEPILKWMGINADKILVSDKYSYITAEVLFVPSFAEKEQKISRWACELLRHQLIPELPKSDRVFPELIYIKCSSSSHIKIENEPKVIDKLNKLGFTIVDFSSLSQLEQFLYTANAKCIVTANRFYLNSIFLCQVETKIIELVSQNSLSNLYWLLSNIGSLEYFYIVTKKAKNDICPDISQEESNSVLVDLDSLAKTIQKSGLLRDRT